METPKKRPSIKGKKKVGSADLAQAERQPVVSEGASESLSDDSSLQDLATDKVSKNPFKKARASKPPASQTGGRKMGMILAGVVAAAVLVCALFVWNTYFRYDDAADIKGEWLVSDGSMVVVIDDQRIKMPDAVYEYSLDDKKKTITFTFAELSGGGSYDFSDGRKTLSVSEGQDNVVVTTFYKMSDKAGAKPRKLSGEKAEQALSKYGPQEQVAVPPEDAVQQGSSGKSKSKSA